MKNQWATVVFFLAFATVQLCMLFAWNRLSSNAKALCIQSSSSSSLSSSSLADFLSSTLNDLIWNNETIPPHGINDDEKKRREQKALKKVGVKPRAFPRWNESRVGSGNGSGNGNGDDHLPFPCIVPPDVQWWHPNTLRSPSHEGLLFVKEMKTGSSTMAGVTIRIARNVARRLYRGKYRLCKLRFDHTSAYKQDYRHRDKARSFLFTIIRDPTSRAVSQFFHFHVSREKVEPTDANFRRYMLMYPYLDHYYLRDLSVRQFIPHVNDTVSYEKAVNDILSEYDFIGITERLDESLVALQMILGLETNDLLYLRAKGSGGYDDAATINRTCQYIVPSFVTPGMTKFFRSKRWHNRTMGDRLLYRAADVSLDMTIDKLGRSEFNQKLLLFRKTLAFAEATCTNVRFPCSESGMRNNVTDCLWLDSGCGVHCLDNIPPLTL